MEGPQKPMEIQVTFPEHLKGGVYSNSMTVTHTREEFVLDFMMVAPPRRLRHREDHPLPRPRQTGRRGALGKRQEVRGDARDDLHGRGAAGEDRL